MQSALLYGRALARALLSGVSGDLHARSLSGNGNVNGSALVRKFHLVTALSGISKAKTGPPEGFKKWSFGDDACFVAEHRTGDVVGVADGVGGWRAYGVDPSKFPQSLMATCERLVKEGHVSPTHPKQVLSKGYREVMENKESLVGSCTACLVALHREENTMYTANLGDSGYLVIRNGQVIHRSLEQQHYFNTPFQLSVAPTVLEGMVVSDSPESADSSSFNVQDGDLILVGTDGLFDNMSDAMILSHIRKLKGRKVENLQKVANSIASEAHMLAFDPDYMSPFAMNAAANGFADVCGGKPDDITVVLSCVTEKNPT